MSHRAECMPMTLVLTGGFEAEGSLPSVPMAEFLRFHEGVVSCVVHGKTKAFLFPVSALLR